MQISEARPPYVTFETRALEDRQATIDAGHFVAKDVDFAIITPAGSKDRIERVVDDWFLQMTQQVKEERLPANWLSAFRERYKFWKSEQALPEDGTPIANWPAISPAQAKTCIHFAVRTLEDLAAANEETLGRLGMGARALKQRAIEYLAQKGSDGSRQAEQLAALKSENADLRQTNVELLARMTALEKQVSGGKSAAGKL